MGRVDSLDAVGEASTGHQGRASSSPRPSRQAHQRQDGLVLRAPPATGTSSSAPAVCGSTKAITAEEITADSYWGHQWVSDLPAAMRPASSDVHPVPASSITTWDHEADVVIVCRFRHRVPPPPSRRPAPCVDVPVLERSGIPGWRGVDGGRIRSPRRRHTDPEGLGFDRFRREHDRLPQRRDGDQSRSEPHRRLLRGQPRALRLALSTAVCRSRRSSWSEPGWEPMGDQAWHTAGENRTRSTTPSPSRHHAARAADVEQAAGPVQRRLHADEAAWSRPRPSWVCDPYTTCGCNR